MMKIERAMQKEYTDFCNRMDSLREADDDVLMSGAFFQKFTIPHEFL